MSLELNYGPRRHANPIFLREKQERINDQNVLPLNEMVRQISEQTGKGIPYFDPDDGGVNARVLLLLEAPGPKAPFFVSCDNDDSTADNLLVLLLEAGLPRREIVIWNVVPFYIGNEMRSKIRAARQSDLDAGRPWVQKLLGLLPRLDTVVLLGRKAQKAELLVRELCGGVRILNGWHPSPLAMNRDPVRRGQLLAKLKLAAKGCGLMNGPIHPLGE